MRMNPKLYQMAEGYEAFEKQEFDGRIVELFYLDDFDVIYNQNVPKGKFAVWSTMNGTDYRLFVEKGFYEEVGRLYSEPINKIWLDFWDQCEDVNKKFGVRFLVPLAVVCLALYLILSFIPNIDSWSMYAQLGIFGVFIIGMLSLNRFTKKKINQTYQTNVALIKEELTEEGFEELVKKQKDYMDSFFEKKQQELDEEIAREEALDKGEEAYIDEDNNVEEVKSEVEEDVNVEEVKSAETDVDKKENKDE